MRLCFFFFFSCRGPPAFKNDTQGNRSLLCRLEKPGHYSAYWYSIRVHILRLLLRCIPVLCTDVTILTRDDNYKTQHNKGQHKSTRHKISTKEQSEGRRSISQFRVRVCSRWFPLSCGVCAGWIPRGERGCDVGGAHRSLSPPRRHQVPQTNEGEETETWTLFIDTAYRGKEFQMGGITGSIVWLAEAL